MDDKIKMLLDSYDLEFLLDENDITDEYVLRWLLDNDMLELTDYFDEWEEEDE